ncbi:hypothetical protein KAI87_17775, partial [Myxococcota bacterium]|nr:hypothetical protein [Myxococcota bacterium]
LVESGAVGVLDIQQALDTQKAEGDSARPLIQILIESDIIDQATGWRALTNHFQAAISHLMEWESGLFSFTSNDISVLDSFSYIPDEVVHESSVDLRTILRDSARIFDERHKAERTLSFMSEGKGSEGKGSMGARVLSVSADSRYKKNAASMRLMRELMQDPLLPQPELSSPDGANLVENILSHAQADAGQVLSELKETPSQDDTSEESFKFAENQRKKVLFLSQDEELKISMESRCAANHMELVISDDPIHIPKIVSGWLLEGLVPVLVVDLPIPREEHKEWDLHTKVMLSELHWTHPEVSVVIIGASDFESNLTAFELGATTFFPRPTLGSDPEQYKLELRKLEEAIEMVVHADFQRRAVLAHLVLDGRRQMSELKNVIHEMQVMGEEVDGSTLVLRFVADFMDRCILFVTRKQDMLAVSSFGIAGYNIDDITSLRV